MKHSFATWKRDMERCACTIGGTVEKNARVFAQKNAALSRAEKLEAIGRIPHMGKPELLADGTIRVTICTWLIADKFACACRTLRARRKRFPVRIACAAAGIFGGITKLCWVRC